MPKRHFGGYNPSWDSKFEAQLAAHLESLGIPFVYEERSFIYVKTVRKSICRDCGSENCGQQLIYTPDLFLPGGIILEAKGYLDSSARERHRLVRLQHPRLDLRMVFQRNHVIKQTKKKLRYGDWCEQHDIRWWSCEKGFPSKEWLSLGQWE